MDQNEAKDNRKIYEIGFHIAPVVSEENIAHEVNKIKDIISESGALFLSEDFPKLKPLAYTMEVHTEGSKKKYNEAYFGWIKFEGSGESAVKLNEAVSKMQNIIRYLIIKTVKENVLYGVGPKHSTKSGASEGKTKSEKAEKPKVEVSQEELDKTIDDLIV